MRAKDGPPRPLQHRPPGRAAGLLAGAVGALLVVGACGGADAVVKAPAAEPDGGEPPARVPFIEPSRLLPEVQPERPSDDAGAAPELRQLLINGIRIAVHEDGRIERADQRFEGEAIRWLALPSRLGDGYLFFQADAQGTRLWRSRGWTATLEPLAKLAATADEIVLGFDRLYLRVEGSNRLLAVDAETGKIAPLGPLPATTAIGAMGFADGWRAVVDADLRGPLATFDAGVSWHSLPVRERVLGAGVEAGAPVVYVVGGRYRVSATGQIQRIRRAMGLGEPDADEAGVSELGPEQAAPSPLGPHPLRTAVLRGWPERTDTALVARQGALIRVRLPEGTVLAVARDAFEERAGECVGARVGAGAGFICGEPSGPTAIYAVEPPFGLRPVVRFDEPRFVAPSDNGALVVRGSCESSAGGDEGRMRTYCIIGRDERRREVGVRGDLGAERLVALGDGRVVVLVPPRSGASGRLTVIDGTEQRTVELALPDGPRKAVRLAEQGLWLDGFEQRDAGTVGGWVEAGGALVGVTVGLDGEVSLGKMVEGTTVLPAGSFALVVDDGNVARQTSDGGTSWLELDLPPMPESPRAPRTRGCSPVGCALQGWIRVGWGEPARDGDLQVAPVPEARYADGRAQPSVRALCRVGRRTSAEADGSGASRPDPETTLGDYGPFHGRPPPRLADGELGVGKGTSSYDAVPAQVYVWGPKGADWSRVGRFVARFRDRFEPAGGVIESSPSRSPWGDQATAAAAIGARSRGGYWRWAARLDGGGRAALLSACRGSSCRLYGVAAGRPIASFRDELGRSTSFRKPLGGGVARVGERWYFLTETGGDGLELWHAELGEASVLARWPRLDRRRYGQSPNPGLVRRAVSQDLGLLLTVPSDPSEGGEAATWVVLPIDLATGELGDPVHLGPADLHGRLPPRCRADQDGWLYSGPLDASVVLKLAGSRSFLDSVELRLRLSPGASCVESVAARTGRSLPVGDDGAEGAAAETATGAVPVAVRSQRSATTWRLWCRGAEPAEPSLVDELLATP